MTRSSTGIASLLAFSACVCGLRAAEAQTPLPQNWLSTQVNESGQRCSPLAETRQADKLLLACGAAGAWEISLAAGGPKFVRSYAFSGDVVGFFSEADGRLWVKLHVLEARPLSAAAAPEKGAAVFSELAPPAPPAPNAAPTTPAPAAPAAARELLGHVERATPGEVVITLGALDGIHRSDHIEFTSAAPDNDGSERPGLSSEVIAVGVVTNVVDHKARVRLGLNESVPTGALAVPTLAQSSSSLSAPPRVSGLWEFEVALRPFAAIDELGGGALLSGSFGYRYTHLHLQ